jgi:cell division protein FtsN
MLSIFAEPIAQEPIRQEADVPEPPQEKRGALLFEDAAEMEPAELERPVETPEEFEIVLGRRQIASVLFVATVILALFSAVSYLAGKSLSPKKITPVAVSVPPTEVSTPVPTPAVPTYPVINASIALSPPQKAAIGAAKSPTLNTSIPKASPTTAASTSVAPKSVTATSVAPKTVAPMTVATRSVTPTSVPVAIPEASTEAPMFAEPAPGAMYLQMGAVDKGAAAIFAEGLRKRGFPSFVATGPNASLFRVLIGPLRDTAAYTRTKDALDRIGVNTFGRTYEK